MEQFPTQPTPGERTSGAVREKHPLHRSSRAHPGRETRSSYQWWGGLGDPLEGAEVIRTDADLAEISEPDCLTLIRELRRSPNGWRAYAAVAIAHASGRRIGAIGSDRLGIDACGLRASDFESVDGRVRVTWRAVEAKGRGYRHGDQQRPATRALAVVFRWLRRYHVLVEGAWGGGAWAITYVARELPDIAPDPDVRG